MRRREVQAPGGRRWVVRRRWAPRLGSDTLWSRFRRRIKGVWRRTGRIADSADVADPGCVVDAFDELAVVLVVILIALLLFFVVIPVLIAIVDLALLLVFAALGVLGRIAFRRPWTVEARDNDGNRYRWKVVGWQASQNRRDEIAQLLAQGIVPPEAESRPAPPSRVSDGSGP